MSSVEQTMIGKHQQWLSVMTQQQIGNYVQNTVYPRVRIEELSLLVIPRYDNDETAILRMHVSL